MKQVGVKTKKSDDNYSFAEHVHRFAVWTSARAVQRNFTTTENIRKAIEQTELQTIVEQAQRKARHFSKIFASNY